MFESPVDMDRNSIFTKFEIIAHCEQYMNSEPTATNSTRCVHVIRRHKVLVTLFTVNTPAFSS